MSIERNYNETFVARLASREKQMQQHYRPVISVHKWFARRPGSLFRALTLAELVDERVERSYAQSHKLSGVCLDMFMGGGTPVLEAARLGLSVIGYDTNPMARWIVERELEDVDPDQLREVGERVAADVGKRVDHLYRTSCPDCGADADVRYFIWVRHHRCVCGEEHPLLSDTMVVSTGLGRHPREVHICPVCLDVSEHKPGKRSQRCRACRACYDDHLVPAGVARACSCGEPYRIPPHGTVETPCQRLAAVEYRCSDCLAKPNAPRHMYKAADEHDDELFTKSEQLVAEQPSRFWPSELIPCGEETARLLRWGYVQWKDLFNARQLHGLGVLAQRIDAEPEGAVKRALQTAFSDFLRYQNALCRYDRQALKPTDVFAMHGFPIPRVSCEANLLGVRGVGSGGFRHALAKYERAKRWCREPYETAHEDGHRRRVRTPGETVAARFVSSPPTLADDRAAYLCRGSLSPGQLAPESVDLVLSDPPYYANVQYAELMDFCFAWLKRLAPETPFFDVSTAKTEQDAVGSAGQIGVDLAEFTARLSKVFAAAAEALKPGAALVFTYHHNDLEAYAPLVVACLDAGLVPTRVYGCPSEMRASTHIHGRNASTVDTVFLLRKPPVPNELARGFDHLDVGRAVNGRVSALKRADIESTPADRACLRHSMLAVRSIARLATDWDVQSPTDTRITVALASLRGEPIALPA